ncbi:MAG: hypothetical protein HYS12_09705 [Planctomycetes bacterium]|nr:hypothetical protein [Planctomycetota bacterium]
MNTLLIAATLVLGADEPPKKPTSARPTALVLKIKGEVVAEGQKGKRRVELGDFLFPGETVSAAADAEALLVFLLRDEHRRLKPGARTTCSRDDCDPSDATEKLGGAAKLPRKNLTKIREIPVSAGGGVGVFRGDKLLTGPAIEPLAGTFVTTTRPAFRWPPVKNAREYLVELRDAGGQLLWKKTAKEAKLAYPEKEKPLQLGLGYLWTVRAALPDDETKVVVELSRFTLVDEAEEKDLQAVRKLAGSDAEADLLLAAAAFEGYHVLAEALEVFEKLARLYPKVARHHLALANYLDLAGRPEKAKESRERARLLGAPSRP